MKLRADLYILRRQQNVSQVELAQAIGVSRMTIYNYEKEASYPNLERAIEIAHYLRVNVTDIWVHENISQFERVNQFAGTGDSSKL